jgi:hypothetical protein
LGIRQCLEKSCISLMSMVIPPLNTSQMTLDQEFQKSTTQNKTKRKRNRKNIWIDQDPDPCQQKKWEISHNCPKKQLWLQGPIGLKNHKIGMQTIAKCQLI